MYRVRERHVSGKTRYLANQYLRDNNHTRLFLDFREVFTVYIRNDIYVF